MSNRWTASCWMGSASGRVDIEVTASTRNGAIEQLKSIYGATQIQNLRKVREESGDFSFPDGSRIWLWGILAGGASFLYLTPWVLMLLYGGAAAWASEKLTGQSIHDYADTSEEETTEDQHKKALILFSAALICGGIGFVHGTFLHKDLMIKYGGTNQIEEVRQ